MQNPSITKQISNESHDLTQRSIPKSSTVEIENILLMNYIFNPLSTLQVKPGTLYKVVQGYEKIVGMGASNINYTSPPDHEARGKEVCPVGHFVTTLTTANHSFMISITDEAHREKFLLQRIKLLIHGLKIIFANKTTSLPTTEVSKEFYEKVQEVLYISMLLSYNKDTALNYLHDYFLIVAYDDKDSLQNFKKKLWKNLKGLKDSLYASDIPKDVIDFSTMENLCTQLVAEYQRTTKPTYTKSLKAGFSILMIGAVGSYLLGNPFALSNIIVTGSSMAFGIGTIIWRRDSVETRTLTSEKASGFTRTARYNLDQAHIHGKLLTLQLKQVRNDKQAEFSILCRRSVLEVIGWKQIGLMDAKTKISREKKSGMNTKKNVLAFSLVYPGNSLYDYDKAYGDAHKSYKRFKAKAEKKSEAKRATSTSTYSALTYKLSNSQLNRGFLAIDNSSKVFFEYDKYAQIIRQNVGDKIFDGVWEAPYIRAKSEFNGLKYIGSLEEYRLKLFDGTRILFRKDNKNITVKDNMGNEHDIPCWKAMSMQKK